VVSPQRAAASERFDGPVVWADGQDATVGAVDIERLRLAREGSGPTRWRWTLEPRDFPPRAAALKPTYVVEYGLVLDTDGNGVADCQVGISNTPGEARVFRHWVRNLRTGVKDERVGPPYGFPFEFVHPEESRERSPQMTFWFLGRSRPCDPIGGAARFYAWASVSDEGRVTAWDLAPDAAWLEMSAPTIP
jgi:hypothetical protein